MWTSLNLLKLSLFTLKSANFPRMYSMVIQIIHIVMLSKWGNHAFLEMHQIIVWCGAPRGYYVNDHNTWRLIGSIWITPFNWEALRRINIEKWQDVNHLFQEYKIIHLLISPGNLTLTQRLAIVLFTSIPTFKFTVLHCFSW